MGSIYLQFHLVVEELSTEIEAIERDLARHTDTLDDAKIEELERRWKELQPLYVKLTGNGKAFLDAAVKVLERLFNFSNFIL